MSRLGRLLVIWGVLLPLLALPTTGEWGPGTVVILGIGLKQRAWIFGYPIRFDAILCAGLLLVGIGLSVATLARQEPR
ncbi:hypothetical protein N825_34955 [Skermanella stibiiresistens SB22]|uniref:Uncharacterized protein n=1 Tax=Skermanella stibiiresistens SB22 TaxID=1385369 RepID=W9H7C6_9PROT|nr:hypothetical protein [Skermanella stibiiresistens]EWY40656.1 hypothetical protein N825_34955 [Skermanella stibiiresistens SB22]